MRDLLSHLYCLLPDGFFARGDIAQSPKVDESQKCDFLPHDGFLPLLGQKSCWKIFPGILPTKVSVGTFRYQ